MSYFTMSRLTHIDVKWANLHKGNVEFLNVSHANPYFELIIVTEGPIYIQVEQEKLTLQSGDCYLLAPWEFHSGWKEIRATAGFYWIQFAADPYLRIIQETTFPAKALHWRRFTDKDLRTGNDTLIDYLLLPKKATPSSLYRLLGFSEKLHAEMANPKGYSRYRANIHLMQIIELLAESLLAQNHMDSSVPASYLTYRHTVNYIEEYYSQELSRDRMETSLGKTYEYICQVFKKHSGMNITAYINQLRIQRAKYLLDNTQRSITEIALEVGYQDAFYFTRIFKKHEGVTPSHYRIKS